MERIITIIILCAYDSPLYGCIQVCADHRYRPGLFIYHVYFEKSLPALVLSGKCLCNCLSQLNGIVLL